MTRIITDNQHYTDIASAIRSKAGVQDLFKPSEMASAIMAIPSGGGSAVLGSKNITENGTYYANTESLDGYSEVIVNVAGVNGFKSYIEGAVNIISDNTVTSIRNSMFYYQTSLREVHLSSVLTIGEGAFQYCNYLSIVDLPLCVSLLASAFCSCGQLSQMNLPKCEDIGPYALSGCTPISTISLPMVKTIGRYAFQKCNNLSNMYLTDVSNVPNLSNVNAFGSTPLSAGGNGSIYVPSSLYNDFLTANNWSLISDRIVSV